MRRLALACVLSTCWFSFAEAADEAGADVVAPASAAPAISHRSLSLSTGVSTWSGDYGAPTVATITAALLSVRLRIDNLRLTAALPYMRIDSVGAVYTGIEGTPLIVAPGSGTTRRVREGLGDLTLSASYLFETTPVLDADIEVFAQVKAPTGSTSHGVSTGSADYALGGEVSRPFGRLAPFFGVSYRSFGDTPTLPLRDGVATTLGASYVFPFGVVARASYDYAARASRFAGDDRELVASASARLPSTPVRLTGYVSGGLSSGAADVSGGFSLSTNF